MAFEYAIALTGGIATGKSTASTILKLLGFTIIDADQIAHKLLNEHAAQIAEMFGEQYIHDGKVDRKALGQLVFSDPNERKRLEAFLHPKIRVAIEHESERMDGYKVPYLIDIPLFFETGAYPIKHSVLVYAPREVQIERLMERDNLTKEEAQQRLNAQMDIEEKRACATYVIDNSKDLKHLQDKCEKFMQNILGTTPNKTR